MPVELRQTINKKSAQPDPPWPSYTPKKHILGQDSSYTLSYGIFALITIVTLSSL